MRIQHNISALNAHRQLGINNSAVAKNLEKLSSGYRINRAGDDAAGLAISEKMRGQIRGLEMAGKNAQDGVSLIQTAEGALQETHSILQRMRELAVQASNGTYEEGFDSKQINKEVSALKQEIDRIADSTHFNNQKLLDGSLSGTPGANGNSAVSSIDVVFTDVAAVTAKTGTTGTKALVMKNNDVLEDGDYMDITINYNENGDSKAEKISFSAKLNSESGKVELIGASGKNYGAIAAADGKVTTAELQKAISGELAQSSAAKKATITATIAADGKVSVSAEAKEAGKNGFAVTSVTTEGKAVGAAVAAGTDAANAPTQAGADAYVKTAGTGFKVYDGSGSLNDSIVTINGKKFAIAEDADKAKAFGTDVNVAIGANYAGAEDELASMLSRELGMEVTGDGNNLSFKAGGSTAGKGGITFQIGANGTKDDRVSLAIANQDAKTLGIASIDLSTQDGANVAIGLLDEALNSVSSTRADLGALQNRLEHTINNLGTSVENLTASESRIRDVDMAKEMMEMTKNNILTQAAQAMLAQANTQPQGVLQLLQ